MGSCATAGCNCRFRGQQAQVLCLMMSYTEVVDSTVYHSTGYWDRQEKIGQLSEFVIGKKTQVPVMFLHVLVNQGNAVTAELWDRRAVCNLFPGMK